MNQTRNKLYNVQLHFQTTLFPHLKQELGYMTKLQQKFIEVLEASQIDSFIPYVGKKSLPPNKITYGIGKSFYSQSCL